MTIRAISTKLIFGVLALLLAIWAAGCGPSANNSPNTNSNSNGTIASPSPTPAGCNAAVDDPVINKYIGNAALDPASGDPNLIARKRHFNFDSKKCVVYLTGYLDTIQNFKALEKIAWSAPKVEKVNSDALWLNATDAQRPGPQGICAPGWIACNDICIPEDQKCNVLIVLNETNAPKSR